MVVEVSGGLGGCGGAVRGLRGPSVRCFGGVVVGVVPGFCRTGAQHRAVWSICGPGFGRRGKVVRVEEKEIGLEIAQGVSIKVVRSMIAEVRVRGEPAPANDPKA